MYYTQCHLISNSMQHVPLVDLGLAASVPATVSMLLSVIGRLGVSVRQGGLDPTATKVTYQIHWHCKEPCLNRVRDDCELSNNMHATLMYSCELD